MSCSSTCSSQAQRNFLCTSMFSKQGGSAGDTPKLNSSLARIPVRGMKNHFKRPLFHIRRSFSPLMCQVPWAKLCAAPLPETRATSQVAESKELRSWLYSHSGQMLQKTNLKATEDVSGCDTGKVESTGDTKLPLPYMLCITLTCSNSFLSLIFSY